MGALRAMALAALLALASATAVSANDGSEDYMPPTAEQQQLTDQQVAQALRVNPATVVRTRKAFLDEGLDAALYDKARPGAVPKITGEIEAKLVTLACSDPPLGRGRWTLRLLADTMVELGYIDSISNQAIGQRLKKTNSSRGG